MTILRVTFDELFKFKIGEDVRHKGDTKSLGSADMGLLVIERHLIEALDGEDKPTYERQYVCRMIRYSGSGDLARFNERELISLKQYEQEQADREKERNEMRTEMRMVEKEVMELFDVSKEDYLYEIVCGKPDTSRKFRMSGFSTCEDGVMLLVTESLFTASERKDESGKIKREDRKWKSKNDFVKLLTNTPN